MVARRVLPGSTEGKKSKKTSKATPEQIDDRKSFDKFLGNKIFCLRRLRQLKRKSLWTTNRMQTWLRKSTAMVSSDALDALSLEGIQIPTHQVWSSEQKLAA